MDDENQWHWFTTSSSQAPVEKPGAEIFETYEAEGKTLYRVWTSVENQREAEAYQLRAVFDNQWFVRGERKTGRAQLHTLAASAADPAKKKAGGKHDKEPAEAKKGEKRPHPPKEPPPGWKEKPQPQKQQPQKRARADKVEEEAEVIEGSEGSAPSDAEEELSLIHI